MTESSVLDAATTPAAHRATRECGTPLTRRRSTRCVAVMRHASDDRHGRRVRAMIVVLWRAGLRIQEALALADHDLDHRRGSILVRSGKAGRRREVGMDEWRWEQLRPWLSARAELPVGRLFCIIDGTTRGRPWSGAAVRGEFRHLAAEAGVRRRFAPHQLRHAHALELAREGAAQHHPAAARARQSRHNLDLPAGDRPGGDHHHRAYTPGADDVRQRRAATLSDALAGARRRSRFALTNQAPAQGGPSRLALIVQSGVLSLLCGVARRRCGWATRSGRPGGRRCSLGAQG